jgi:ABC-type glycerol-3-phosphate transport system substrate-binding protein
MHSEEENVKAIVTRRTLLGGSLVAGAGMLMAACGQAMPATMPEEGEAPAAKDEAKPAEQAKVMEPKTVRYLHYTTTQAVWEDNFGQIFDAYRAKFPEVILEVDPVTGGFGVLIEKAVSSFAGNVPIDMYYGHFSYISQFAQNEMIQPLDPFIAKDTDVTRDEFYDHALERIAGQIYGIAWFNQGKEFWYNADQVTEAGLTSPSELAAEGKWTWDAALEFAQKLTKKEGPNTTRWGFYYAYYSTGWFGHHLRAWGADWWNADISAPTMNTPEFAAAVQAAQDMVTKHEVSPRRSAPRENDAKASFEEETLSARLASGANTRSFQATIMTKDEPFNIGHTLLPEGPGGRNTIQAINANYLSSSAPEPDLAWELYKILIGPESDQQIARLGGRRYTASRKQSPVTLWPYENADVYAQMAELSEPAKQIVKQSEVSGAWGAGWNDMEDGARTVQEVQDELQQVATIALEEGGCIC